MTVPNAPIIQQHINTGETCCDPEWEAAYERFESPAEEIEKFVRRLRAFGLDSAPKEHRVVELFCGRGGGLVALQQLGFQWIEGVDLSGSLLERCSAPSVKLHLADCRDLPFPDESFEIAIVQGGLHHLPNLPGDLDAVLDGVRRILKPTGRFYVVEPWLTPFLRLVHAIVEQTWVRRIYPKGDALAEMIDHERITYEQWLGQPDLIRDQFRRHFQTVTEQTRWGKLVYAGQPLPI